ncbi:FAD dependent oxidoreductase [Panus rudis PR-1116 ss-1]|nr:FAD dependent oxidoreductase [Panus rudis PR-1116 ss-1]
MGNLISRARLLIAAIFYLNKTLDVLSKRLKASPGIPVPNPTRPFWTYPKAKISSEGKALPQHADIVIIGSGITGTSFAYNVFQRDSSLRVVMLEAREVCSGATGRNGGHINPPLYHDYKELKERHGEAIAKLMIKFRLAHYDEMLIIAKNEDILEHSQCRPTEQFDVHFTLNALEEAEGDLEVWKSDMPEEASSWKKFGLSSHAVGCIHGNGGAMHPYRFVTSLLSKLLDRHSDRFFIATQTPCTDITPPTPSSQYYTIHTPKGTITTPHVIHATNGWVSHLVPPFREKVIPARGTMSAQRPGTSLNASSTKSGDRSFVFYSGSLGYDYLTQLPTGEKELMFGGGWASAMDGAIAEIGETDDSKFSYPVASHLSGSLPLYFGAHHWGREKDAELAEGEEEGLWDEGRTKAQWSGILGLSADGLPWVGRLSTKLTGRVQPTAATHTDIHDIDMHMETNGRTLTAPPGEWIAAGYTGEGMVHAWMSGKALAYMVLDREEEIGGWFPEILRATEKRWKKADIVEFISRYF